MGQARVSVALIVGAGWSAAAGYPTAGQLLSGRILVGTSAAQRRVQAVLDAYQAWRTKSAAAAGVEQFLAEVRAGSITMEGLVINDRPEPSLFDPGAGAALPWQWAVEAVCLQLSWRIDSDLGSVAPHAVLLPKRQQYNLRYRGQVTSPSRSKAHINFLRCLLVRHHLSGVVTTNYDTLMEQVLRHRRMLRKPEPGFYYGGLPRPQALIGSNPWDRFNEPDWQPGDRSIEVTGEVPLCKLHGSLHWEWRGGDVTLWRDHRLPYRHGGEAAIVAPVLEKRPDPWIEPVWTAAIDVLRRADTWIVVGYSLPPYDYAVRDLLREASSSRLQRIVLHDPAAASLVPRWREVTAAEVLPAPALGLRVGLHTPR